MTESESVQGERHKVDDAFNQGLDEGYDYWLGPLPAWYYTTPAINMTAAQRGYFFGRLLRAWLHEGGETP